MKLKKEQLILMLILAIGVVARIVKFNAPDLVMDTVVYSRLGKNLIEFGRYYFGENYNMGVFFPPGYPAFIGITNLIFHDLFFSAKLVSFAGSCVSILLAYVIGKKLYDTTSGLFAALLFAVYPVIILVSVQGYSDALFIMFLLLSIYIFFWSLETDNLIAYPILGFSIAMTYYMRPEGVFILLLPFLQMFGIFGGRVHFNKRYVVKAVSTFFVFILIISPYMIFLKNHTGKFTLSGKGNVSMILGEFGGDYEYHQIVNAPDNFYDRAAFALNQAKTELRGWGTDINFSMKDYVLKNPVNFLKKYQKNVLQQIQVLIKLLIPVAIPLFFAFFYRDLFHERRRLIFILLPVMFFLIYPMFIIIEKQTLLIVVFLLIFASGGFSNAGSSISDLADYYSIRTNKFMIFLVHNIRYLIIIVLTITGLSYLSYSRFQNFDPAHAKPEEHKRAGYFLKEKLSPDYEELNVMARKPYVSYYSGARFTMLPYADIPDVINFAKRYNVDFIVVDERSLSKWDAYDKLLELQAYSNDVRLFYEDNSSLLIRVFRLTR
jgi:4-amino-4-deoxy-L-arabinose transferase-like glycosyltransferase